MRLSLGYPEPAAERALLKGRNGRVLLANMQPTLNGNRLKALQSIVPQVRMTDTLLDYVQRLIAYTRRSDVCHLGLSPRGALALVKAAQAWALLQTRGHVLPEDVQAVFIAVAGHRLIGRQEAQGDQLARHILSKVDVVGSGNGNA
jgi:MoxR-like ATPase